MAENTNTEREAFASIGEEQAFEAWFKMDCPVDGINARLAAKAAWQARASMSLPAAGQEPVATDEWKVRGYLAATLKCWHRLTDEEAAELVAMTLRLSGLYPASQPAASVAGQEPDGIKHLGAAESAHETITKVIHELRTYNPLGDEYGGKHVHKGWADQLESVAPPKISELDSEYWLRNRAAILRAISERGFQLVSSGGLFWLSGAAPQPAVAAGWMMVPIEPTNEMLDAGRNACEGRMYPQDMRHGPRAMMADKYRAMLKSAPLPPAPSTEGERNG